MIEMHRRLRCSGASCCSRALQAGVDRRNRLLSLAKILENMEIGHNVMHGQWDWMNDPQINSSTWDWDSASTPEAWKHSHNYIHHTYTNIRGKDHDLGYEIMRIDPHQKWNPVYLCSRSTTCCWWRSSSGASPCTTSTSRRSARERSPSGAQARAQGDGPQGAPPDRQGLPRLPGAVRPQGLQEHADGQLHANVIRNVWAHAIIFCGHFPDQTYTFSQDEVAGRDARTFYVRQLLGAANIEGSPLFHVISGNLGYQVEHHLFPDMPSTRYAEIAPQVKEICERYELPYNSGPFFAQWRNVQRTILRLALPGGRPRPKPGPYRRDPVADVTRS